MLEILQISENGLKANQAWLNAISHNVANIQTPGFKKSVVNFGELVNIQPSETGGTDVNMTRGMGVAIHENLIDARQGDMKSTGRMLDLAIDGNGFFEVERQDGQLAYTRVGQFKIAEDGRLVSAQGLSVSGEIVVPPDTQLITVESDGRVFAEFVDGDLVELGQLTVVNFANPGELKAIGNELYAVSNKSGEPEDLIDSGSSKILQGYLEMSNVELIDEMSELLLAQRAYQLNARLIQTADQILETINNIRR